MNNLVCLLFVSLVIFVSSSDGEVCHSEACQKFSNEIKSIVNLTNDPCHDFSSYVCGKYSQTFSLLPGEHVFGSFVEIGDQIKNELRAALDNQPWRNKYDAKTKAKRFYQSCLDLGKRDEISSFSIVSLISKIMKGRNYEERLANLLKSSLNFRIVGFSSFGDFENPDMFVLVLNIPKLILQKEIFTIPERNQKILQFYKVLMNSVLDELGMWQNERHLIDEIFLFQSKIAKAMPSIIDMKDPLKYNNKISIGQLRSACPEINWRNLINLVMKGTGKIYKTNDPVLVLSLSYIKKLCPIIYEYKTNSTKLRILDMDLEWAVIQSVLSFSSKSFRNQENKFFKEAYGITFEKELWKTCIEITSSTLTEIMGHIYVINYFQDSQKKDIEKMIYDVQKSLERVLQETKWMDESTKCESLKKLQSMGYKIGFYYALLSEEKINKKFAKLPIGRDNFIENFAKYKELVFKQHMELVGEKIPHDMWPASVHQVNAFYNPLSNEIFFPAAILRYPFYDIGLPINIKYGAIGSVMGHEILHGFDTQGSQYDEKGRFRNWWTKEIRRKYENKTQCIIQQYKEYKIHNMSLPAEQTISEDIADNAGIRMAYKTAFHSDENRKLMTVPGLNFTAEQLFFISYGRIWCTLLTKFYLLSRLRTGVHSVWKFRINGPLSNMPEFSNAFNCNATSQMNRVNKCLVW